MVGPETPGHFATLILDPHGLHLEKNIIDGMSDESHPGPGLKSHMFMDKSVKIPYFHGIFSSYVTMLEDESG